MLEDRILLWRFKAGSRDAFCRIYEKYVNDLLTLAANLLGNSSTAEDVVQDVFITFVKSAQNFRLTGSLKGYLATCVANRARDYIRQNKRRPTVAVDEIEQPTSDEKSPLELAVRSEELQKLSHAMNQIPFEQRETVVLHLNGCLRFRQIAGLQNVSVKTVQSRYRYGLEKLRSVMNGEVKK